MKFPGTGRDKIKIPPLVKTQSGAKNVRGNCIETKRERETATSSKRNVPGILVNGQPRQIQIRFSDSVKRVLNYKTVKTPY